ncbi:phage/plasmid primase, P4 family, partial [Thermogutta sp.]|uniref:phage/plasmid primase, P4 family n=1 Tax=Thermogutta sp. TaxID=1962930 RepID=UPI00321FD7C5
MLDYALAYAELGWAVVFLAEREKTPLTRHGYADATKDPDKIKRWWSLRPEANIGIRVGRESGIVVLDVDPRNGGDETLARLSELYSPIPTTPTVATGGGGLHMYFAWHEDIQNREIGPGLELKADSGYVVAPPSVHPSGNRYAWVEGLDPWSVGLASMPVWLSTAKSETANIDLPLRVRRWDLLPIGRRNTSLFLLALVASTLGMSTTALHRYLELLVDNLVEQTPGDAIGLREIEQMVRWNASHDIGELLSVEDPESDKGAAEMLSIFSDGRYLYCPEIKSFLRWHQGRWERMDTGLGIVYELASLLRITAMSLGEQLDHDMLKRMWKLSSCLSSEPKAVRVLRSVSTTNMVRSIDEFDDDPYLLNCRNGIVDLRTGEIRTQTPDDLVMHSTGVDYDPTAESQLWNRFLSEATGGDPALVAYLQRLAGYCATGLTELETFWLLLGPAGSGKSTFTAAIRTALGSYARHVSSGLFAVSGIGSERPTPELARLKGCRIVLATELEPAATLNSPVVKAVVSGEEIVVRELYCPP